LKIYFSGSTSCGKSTLARYVSETYDIPLISETARMILSEQELQIDELRTDLVAINKFQNDVFQRQLLEEKKYDAFVSDRSLIDVIAYSAAYTEMLTDLLSYEGLEEYLEELRSSLIFFVRPSKATLKADGVRGTINWDEIIAIDAIIKTLYDMSRVRYIQINSSSIQERTRLINNILALITD